MYVGGGEEKGGGGGKNHMAEHALNAMVHCCAPDLCEKKIYTNLLANVSNVLNVLNVVNVLERLQV